MGTSQNLDRRNLLGVLGASMAMMAVPKAVAAGEITDPCNPLHLPYHLSVLDPAYPDALVPHGHKLALIATQGKKDRVVAAIDDLVKKNKAFFQKTQFVKKLAPLVKSNKPPKTVQEMFALFEIGWVVPELCEPVKNVCKDFGCDDECWLKHNSPGGACLPVGFLGGNPCECVCFPGVFEFALMALIILLLLATPAPDEIPAILAAISRLIIRRAPVPVVP